MGVRKRAEYESEIEIARFAGLGTVYSWTVVSRNATPEGFTDFAPYAVAWIKLIEGPIVTAMLTDVDNGKIYIGMPVEIVTRIKYKLGDGDGLIIYGYKFRPILGTE